jgi:ABC-type transport system involved in cytochrome c biogenesis permease subunit
MDRVDVVCFFASYGLALVLELWHLLRPRPVFRLLALGLGLAGLLAHSIYLYREHPPLMHPFGWLLFLAWVFAVFYVYGALHHRKQAWGVFVLPLVLGLLGIGVAFGGAEVRAGKEPLVGPHPLGALHGVLIFLATIGVCVGFVASLMYLFQAHRLRAKLPPGKGLRLLSLERLEAMNRRAILLAFPLLTAGVLAGAILLVQGSEVVAWTDSRVVSTTVLWLAFGVMLFLRLGHHLRGRQVALLTIAAFAMLLCCIILSHPPREAGVP